MTIKKKYENFNLEVYKNKFGDDYSVWLGINTIEKAIPSNEIQLINKIPTEAEAWQWVEDNFPLPDESSSRNTIIALSEALRKLPDIEAIKKNWQKRLKPIESNTITATPQQIEINKRQQEIGEQRIIAEILSDLREK